MLMNDDIKFDTALKHGGANGSAADHGKSAAQSNGGAVAGLPANTAYIVKDPETEEPPLFASTNQI